MNGRLLIAVLLTLLIQSCANYQLNYHSDAKDWEATAPSPSAAIKHQVFLIGGTGGEDKRALSALSRQLDGASPNSSLLLLGNTLLPDGMPPKNMIAERGADEARLEAQLKMLEGYTGNIYVIPGHADWKGYGIPGLERQKDFIEKRLDRDDVWFPDPGCGEPEEVEIGDDLIIVLIDSQWYLEDWDNQYRVNAGCEIKSRAVFEEYVLEAIKGNRNKNVLVAMHHPPFTTGPHGGQYTLKQHLFPLTDIKPGLYLPLPVVGSLVQFIRGTVGTRQDAMHPKYQELSDMVVDIAEQNGSFVFVSGHERSLQYIEREEQAFIVAGAGSDATATNIREGSEFAYGHTGFARLDYHEDGSAWASFFIPHPDFPQGKLVYRTEVRPPLPNETIDIPDEYPTMPDSVTVEVSERNFMRGAVWNFLWGDHYRQVYNTEVTVPTLDLSTYKGGLRPIKRGGGFQTNSLRLEAKNGQQYALRSINKDASRTLGSPFDDTFVTAILQDNFSAAHPFASVATAALADEANLFYTQPKVVYLLPQEGLGIYNEDYPGELYTIEERPDDEVWQDYEQFGAPKEIHSTSNTREHRSEEHDEQIDYPFVVRNRLFDVLIGDWDRHDDQWRWSEIADGNIDYYHPIPRDRDQAFSNFDGFLLAMARGSTPDIKKLAPFREKVKKVEWLTYNGRHFDRTFLSGADWEDWKEQAQHLQRTLTDEVIEEAFRENWPENIYEISAPEIIRKLKSRRNQLVDIAGNYYRMVSREVDVLGTLKRDLFEVQRLEAGKTRVQVFDTNSEGEKGKQIFDRTFVPNETREVILYGLTDMDVFEISGEAGKGPLVKVRIIGGLGNDTLQDNSNGRGIIYYDAQGEGNDLQKSGKTRIRLKRDPLFNTYDRESPDYNFNYSSVIPNASFNPDDGVLLGLNGSYRSYGFKKSPYASEHKLSLLYALATSGMRIEYQGEFIDLFGPFELGLDAGFQTLLYSTNFYGFGNETLNPEEELDDQGVDDERDFNRVRQRALHFKPSFMRKLNDNSRVLIGPTFESFRVEKTEGRFIAEQADQLNPDIFDGVDFLGAQLLFHYQSKDNPSNPSRGIEYHLEGGWKQQLSETQDDYSYINTYVTAYQRIDKVGRLIFATRIGWQRRFGNGYEFFQAASLGGPGPDANFRGLRRSRYIGRTAFYQNIDLRYKLVTSGNPTLPFSLGVTGGFDHGRVWQTGEDSDIWHYSYGGSVWISPFDLFVLNTGAYKSDRNELRFMVGGGFFF